MWNLTFLLVHLAAMVGFIHLYKAAPCWMQKVSVAGFVVAMGFLSMGFALALAEVWGHWYFVVLGFSIADLSVLLYVFRLIYQQHLEWKPSSIPSRSS